MEGAVDKLRMPSGPYQLLGIDPVVPFTRIELRRTYLRRLRHYPPERDPDGFRALHAAFEFLQKFANQDPEVEHCDNRESVAIKATQSERVCTAIYQPSDMPDTERAPHVSPGGETAPTEPAESASLRTNEPPRLSISLGDSAFDDRLRPPLPPLADPPNPPSTLADVVAEGLAHLAAGDIPLAEALDLEWRNHACVDDYRDLHDIVALRWALTRELMSAAGALPAPVTNALAKAILADDLASARSALEAYGQAYPKQAGDANVVLATRTSSIYAAVKGALFDPDAWQNRSVRPGAFSTLAVPPVWPSASTPSSRSGGVALVIGIVIGTAALISVCRVAERHSELAYESRSVGQLGLTSISPMPDFSSLCFGERPPRFMFDDPAMEWDELTQELNDVATHEAASDEQRNAANALLKHVGAKRCNKMVAALHALDEADESSHRCAYEVDRELSFMLSVSPTTIPC